MLNMTIRSEPAYNPGNVEYEPAYNQPITQVMLNKTAIRSEPAYNPGNVKYDSNT